jgi:hypothetical protein
MFGHFGDQAEQHAPLAEEGVGSALGRAGSQPLVEAEAFAGGAQQSE